MKVYASNTPAEHKDLWMTPIEIFTALDAEFGFYLDAAASHDSALCARYLTEQDNALLCDWESYGPIWCNPPYSKILSWINKATEQCQRQRQPIVMLLPADTSTAWFNTGLMIADEIRFITGGRISFINAGTGEPGKNGNSKGSVLFIWRPHRQPQRIFTTVDRDELAQIGRKILQEVMAA